MIGLAVACLGSVGARAATVVYSENFDSAAFLGSYLGPVGNFSERWTNTQYYTIHNANGWNFTGSSYLARDVTTGNQAVLLNETTGVATHVTGLAANTTYQLSFNLSGDNVPNNTYRFLLDINGTNVLNLANLWTATNSAGHLQNVTFSTDSTGQALLRFYQNSSTPASPIIDDIVVSTTASAPDGGATLGLLGLGLLGVAGFRRRRA